MSTVILVTGACGGLGFEFCRRFVNSRRPGTLLLACRSVSDGESARSRLLLLSDSTPRVHVDIVQLDLSNFASVRQCAAHVIATHAQLDVLVLNAGVMFHRRQRTVDELDLTLQTNFYGHFLLTRLLQPALDRSSAARVVAVSSVTHWLCDAVPFDDLHQLSNTPDFVYKERVYCLSKLMDLLFVAALQRRYDASESSNRCSAVACHPGWSKTMLMEHPASESWWFWLVFRLGNPIFAQSAEAGSLPLFVAAFDDDVRGGDYIGPDGCLFGFTGANAIKARRSALANDPMLAEKLWNFTEKLLEKWLV
jgi:NAD(P)-dependent dehydrogenase (short-subunit alcohol dehydrogenase family)